MRNMKKPIARQDNIVMQELETETLIYDLEANKAFCLNETSKLVWQLCDGKNTVAEISDKLSEHTKTLVSEEFVWLAIDQLSKEELIENGNNLENYFDGLSRREIIKRIGFASALTLPVISSLVAPQAAMSQSLVANGGACPGGGSECISGNCLFGQCCSATSVARNPPGFTICTSDQAAFDANCCSGSSTLGSGVCPPGESSYICDPF